MHTKFLSQSLKESSLMEDIGVVGDLLRPEGSKV